MKHAWCGKPTYGHLEATNLDLPACLTKALECVIPVVSIP